MKFIIGSLFISAVMGLRVLHNNNNTNNQALRMPGVQPEMDEQYLCRTLKLDTNTERYITAYEPHADMETVHHMLLYGCITPGTSDEVWNCGKMGGSENSTQYQTGPVCSNGPHIIFAWARDAPKFHLPDGVGFKVGSNTDKIYLVLQVHYMLKGEDPDYSGLTIQWTTERMPKTAGIFLVGTDGWMKALSKEYFESACVVDENVEAHPFAFRTHTHDRGKLVSGYLVREEQWSLIGKKNPMLPQMFYPVVDPTMIIREDDILAARCTMINEEDRNIYTGPTNKDEMCNFYIMYWVDGDKTVKNDTCFSPGPPDYYWHREAGLKDIPVDASSL